MCIRDRVRGLDYYTRTVFEFPSKSLGFALGGGGRYDGLVEEMGGKPTAGLGFGLGLDLSLIHICSLGSPLTRAPLPAWRWGTRSSPARGWWAL